MKNRDHAIVDKVFMGLIDRWDRDERASRVMTMIQVVIMEIENTQLPIFKSKTVLQKKSHEFKYKSNRQEYVGCCGASGNRLKTVKL